MTGTFGIFLWRRGATGALKKRRCRGLGRPADMSERARRPQRVAGHVQRMRIEKAALQVQIQKQVSPRPYRKCHNVRNYGTYFIRHPINDGITGCAFLGARQARIQDFCQGRAPRELLSYMGWELAIFDIRKHRFATFQEVFAILCLNGVQQPFKRHQCPFFLPLRRGNPRLRRGSFRPRGGRPPQRPPPQDPRLLGVCVIVAFVL